MPILAKCKQRASYPVTEEFRTYWATKIDQQLVHVDEATFPRMFAWDAWNLKERERAEFLTYLDTVEVTGTYQEVFDEWKKERK